MQDPNDRITPKPKALTTTILFMLQFQIQATDKGLPPLSSDIHSLSIQVIDVNNFLPTFQNTTKKLSVAENSQNGTLVGTVTATDKDKHSRTCYNISSTYLNQVAK